jgi:hypothetical protein
MTDRSPTTSGAAGPAPTINFPAFVLSLAHTAAVHFGDAADPTTGKPGTPNLLGAQQMIEILALIEEKTRGNLSAEERQLIERVLYELRMRYVQGDPRIVQP